jgi:hypothetical protein
MRLKCLGCDALARPLYLSAAQSPHIVDVTLFQLGLHNDPADLRDRLQAQIDEAVGRGYDAVLLAYGLCGKSTAGLIARDIPVVIPRAHDCITLFLGGRERYQEQFEQHPGTYWYAVDYVERRGGSDTTLSLGADTDTDMSGVYDEYVRKYGQDNADFLMEVMGAWKDRYQRAAFIDMGVGDGVTVETHARDEATRRGWAFECLAGDLVLIHRLFAGDWDDDFLILQPGQQIEMTYDRDVIGCIQI